MSSLNRAVHIVCLGLALTLAPAALRAESKVTYQDHVLPIFRNHCLNCHNADKKKGDLDLSSYIGLSAGGGSGEVVEAGEPQYSTLYLVVSHEEEPNMPPKSPKLPETEIAVIRQWIKGGMLENLGSKVKTRSKPKVDLALSEAPIGKPSGPAAMPQDLLLEPVVRHDATTAVTAVAASPWAPLIALAGQKQVLLYHSETLELLGVLPFPEGFAYTLKFSRNGQLLLAGGGRGAKLGRVVVWDVKSGDRVMEVGEEYDAVLAADISADQHWIALGGPGKLIKLFSTTDGELVHTIKKHTDWITAMAYSPDGVLLATGDRNGGVHVWEAYTGRIFYSLTGHKAGITDISWRPDANLVATASEDGTVKLWSMSNGAAVKSWGAHGGGVLAVEYAHDGRIVTSGRDKLTRIWDGNGKKLRDLPAFRDLALRVAITHDDKRVVAGDWTGEVRVWQAEDGKQVGTLATNPPTLDERLAADSERLAELEASHRKVVSAREAAEAAAAKAAAALAAARASAGKAAEALKASQSKLTSAKNALAAAVDAAGQADAAVKVRRAELEQQSQVAGQAKAGLEKVQAEHAEAVALVERRRAEAAKQAEAAAKAVKAAEAGKASDDVDEKKQAELDAVADRAKASADSAASELKASLSAEAAVAKRLAGATDALAKADTAVAAARDRLAAAQKTVAEQSSARASAEAAARAAEADLAAAKKAVQATTETVTAKQQEAEKAAAAVTEARAAQDTSAAKVAAVRDTVARWRAGQVNVKVYAARRTLSAIADQHAERLATAEASEKRAAEAASQVATFEKAMAAGPEKVKQAQTRLAAARQTAAKAKADLDAANAAASEQAELAARASEFAGQLEAKSKQTPDNASLGQAAAKAKEAAVLLLAEVEAAKKLVAQRAAAGKKVLAEIEAARQDVEKAEAFVAGAPKRLDDLRAAHRGLQKQAESDRAAANALMPKLEAATSEVDRLAAQYQAMKPKG